MNREQFIRRAENCQNAFRRFLTALCCGDSQLADDIAQESLLKAYLSCDGLNEADKFNAWLYRIGVNTFLTHRRNAAVRASCSYDEAMHAAAGESADSAFRYQSLYRALDRLSERERSSILLFYMEGYAVREIAEIVGASQNAVKQHLSRGRIHLRTLLCTEQS